MTKENAKDFLPLVQAMAEGKVIQYFEVHQNKWTDKDEPCFTDDIKNYRIKPEQRMTYIQLMKWLNEGNGMFKYNGFCYTNKSISEKELNNEVDKHIVIRIWDSEEWIEPTVDIYERDCKSVTQDTENF